MPAGGGEEAATDGLKDGADADKDADVAEAWGVLNIGWMLATSYWRVAAAAVVSPPLVRKSTLEGLAGYCSMSDPFLRREQMVWKGTNSRRSEYGRESSS